MENLAFDYFREDHDREIEELNSALEKLKDRLSDSYHHNRVLTDGTLYTLKHENLDLKDKLNSAEIRLKSLEEELHKLKHQNLDLKDKLELTEIRAELSDPSLPPFKDEQY